MLQLLIIVRKMGYIWRLIVNITLFIDIISSVGAEVSSSIPINFTTILIETVEKFQLQGLINH